MTRRYKAMTYYYQLRAAAWAAEHKAGRSLYEIALRNAINPETVKRNIDRLTREKNDR